MNHYNHSKNLEGRKIKKFNPKIACCRFINIRMEKIDVCEVVIPDIRRDICHGELSDMSQYVHRNILFHSSTVSVQFL